MSLLGRVGLYLPQDIRFSVGEDLLCLEKWIEDPKLRYAFSMFDFHEAEHSSLILWNLYIGWRSSLTLLCDGRPAGMAVLYLNHFQGKSKQCLFCIIVDPRCRGRGLGRRLLSSLINVARHHFKIKLLHLEVFEQNPAIRLYERMGFVRYGIENDFLRDDGVSMNKILMEKVL